MPLRREREIGSVVFVSNYRVTVLLNPDIRSQVRSHSNQITIIAQIGGYLLFPVGPGENAVGIIVGAMENETVEPDADEGMTLQLGRARRTLRVNLVGKLLENESFMPGISIYPALDTPALLPTDQELRYILEYCPKTTELARDIPLPLGFSPIYSRQQVTVSYNDLFGRPFGIIGNTGSGKSYSVASIIQGALSVKNDSAKEAKIFVLDINGEYSRTFAPGNQEGEETEKRELNRAYINSEIFRLPLWSFNLGELISFFEAAEASQVPVLERVVTFLREQNADPEAARPFRDIVRNVDHCRDCLGILSAYAAEVNGRAVCENAAEVCEFFKEYRDQIITSAEGRIDVPSEIRSLEASLSELSEAGLRSAQDYRQRRRNGDYEGFNRMSPSLATAVQKMIDRLEPLFEHLRSEVITRGALTEITADTPEQFDPRSLDQDALFRMAIARFRGQERIQEYVATLRLRIHRQLSDRRWTPFTDISNIVFLDMLKQMLGKHDDRVVIVDCSLLAHDVLPFFCAIFARIILDLRERADPAFRITQPFTIVLEEAHNYLKPKTDKESFGIRLSRETYERIAKEGRKFGLSLIIASQRPSDVSPTVLSQCANFLVHRIQNPEDIDYFKKVLPLGSRDLLDQLPILAPGDGLLLGSGVNVPARVKITIPNPAPTSDTPRPWESWQEGSPRFNLERAVKTWLGVQDMSNGHE